MCSCWHWLISPCQLLSQKSCLSASSQCGLPSHPHFPFCSACREASKNRILAPGMQPQGQFCWHRLQSNADTAEPAANVRPCAPQPHTARLHASQPHAAQHSHMQHSHTERSTATRSAAQPHAAQPHGAQHSHTECSHMEHSHMQPSQAPCTAKSPRCMQGKTECCTICGEIETQE